VEGFPPAGFSLLAAWPTMRPGLAKVVAETYFWALMFNWFVGIDVGIQLFIGQ
jgi:hypothetical protein